jgi:hypothetical protein
MDPALECVAVAMTVPAVAVIWVVILERRQAPEKPNTPEIVLLAPTLAKSPGLVVTRRRWRWP